VILRNRTFIVSAMGVCQILSWGSTFYLPAVLAPPVAAETGWPLPWIVGGTSLGLLVSAVIAPRVGRTIQRHGGRPVLAASAMLIAAGLVGLSVASVLPVYVALWLVVGAGMGCGLYDASFASLGRLYGREARSAITVLTLWAGFASTVCWPFSAFLVEQVGWRGACLVYAALQMLVVLPIYLLVLPRPQPAAVVAAAGATPAAAGGVATEIASPILRQRLLVLLMLSLPSAGAVMAIWSVHLITILQAEGVALAAAVAMGALVGPAQAGSRIVEMLGGRAWHPIWTMTASAAFLAGGMITLLTIGPLFAIPILLYGFGAGIWSIARGALPLALFGPVGYATLIGRLAMPIQASQAAAPTLAALVLEHAGVRTLLYGMTAVAALNLALVAIQLAIVLLGARQPRARAPDA